MSLANRLTLARVITVPVLAALLYLPFPGMRVCAAIVFFLAAVTDILDGYVARKQGTVSNFGKIMDPIADKLLVLCALAILIYWQETPAWAGIVIFGREMVISGLRMVVLSSGGEVIAASWLGKVKTVTQDIAVICLLLQKDLRFVEDWYIAGAMLWISIAFALWSGVDYCVGAAKSLKKSGGTI